MTYERSIGVSFRGFENVQELIETIGVEPTSVGRIGQSVKPHIATTFSKNIVSYQRNFSHEMRWGEAIERLVEELGGVDRLQTVVAEFRPEFVHFDLTLPIRNSDHQEDNYVEATVMAKLVTLNASLGCSFV